jgi:signal peptidase I
MSASSIHRRKPPVALLMSFALPGFGQLYNGQINKAIWLFLCFGLLSIPGLALIALFLPPSLTVPALALALLATVGLWVFGMADAWRVAGQSQEHLLKPWQLSGVYALVFLLCNALALPLLIGHVREHQVASYRIPSRSMEPSVLQGDVLFASKRYNRPEGGAEVQRGDIPNNRTQHYIKRVIALPGDRVRVAGHAVWVNDKPLTRREAPNASGIEVTEGTAGREWHVVWAQPDAAGAPVELTVPPGQAYVLGDNRSMSQDTRHFGTVPLSDIIGQARQVWFSSGAPSGMRWERLGHLVE